MKAQNLLLFFSIFILFSFTKSTSSLDFDFANSYCNKIEKQTTIIAKKYDLEAQDVLPIVYPECSRFNVLSNVFETDLLSHFYVEKGCVGADFSVGYFQMKPSFIENLEQIIQNDSSYNFIQDKFSYTIKNPIEIRKQRLDRLFSESWQIEYLCAYVKIMKNRFQKEKIEVSEIDFLASAYNYGFHKKSGEIISWSKVQAFPNGIKSHEQNYAYCELAKNYKLKTYGHE